MAYRVRHGCAPTNVKFGEDVFEVTDSTRFFEVVLDNRLRFTGHVDDNYISC